MEKEAAEPGGFFSDVEDAPTLAPAVGIAAKLEDASRRDVTSGFARINERAVYQASPSPAAVTAVCASMDYLKRAFGGMPSPSASVTNAAARCMMTSGDPKVLGLKAPTITIAVTGYSDESGKTEYLISTVFGAEQYQASQRFSAFLTLHESLSKFVQKEGEPIPFPLPKKLFVNDDAKKERVVGLQAYLSEYARPGCNAARRAR